MKAIKNVDPIDGLWNIGLSIWLSFSIYFAFIGNGDLFQRFGAFLVAIVGVYYAAIPQPIPYELHEIERDKIATKSTKMIGDMTALAHERIGVLAAALLKAFEAKKEEVPDAIRSLAKPILDENYKPIDLSAEAELNQRVDDAAKQRIAASHKVVRVNSIRNRVQAATLAVGTIQWGFGDMLFNGAGL